MEFPGTHYIAFAAFVQLAVALNFGMAYLDRRSGLLSLKRKIFNSHKAGNTAVVGRVSNILKRYRSGSNYSMDAERAHTKTKQYHAIVTSDWDDEHEISFFPVLGVIYGFYGLALLFMVCFFDIQGNVSYYQNQILILSQITLVWSGVLIIWSWHKGAIIRFIPSVIIYVLLAIMGWICCHNGWVFECKLNFAHHFHWYVLSAYLPIIYYMFRIVFLFFRKTLFIIPMVWWANKFNAALDK